MRVESGVGTVRDIRDRPKGSVEAARQEVCEGSFDYSMSKAEIGEKNKRK
jgi:hypothetical protein